MRSNWSIISLLFLILVLSSCAGAQKVPERLTTGHPPLDRKLASLISADENAISPAEAILIKDAIYLDTREIEEYEISHLPNALFLGYKSIDYSILDKYDLNTPIIIYCTVGYRSEKIADKLRERGFAQVYNLYGSLYAWKLAGYDLVDTAGKITDKLHTYNKKWGSFVPEEIGEKVW